jgi:hypothetical protein
MATKRKMSASKTQQPDTTYEPRYINPHVSFGFYKLFSAEANADILQELLPVLLGKDIRIQSLRCMGGGCNRDRRHTIEWRIENGEWRIMI